MFYESISISYHVFMIRLTHAQAVDTKPFSHTEVHPVLAFKFVQLSSIPGFRSHKKTVANGHGSALGEVN